MSHSLLPCGVGPVGCGKARGKWSSAISNSVFLDSKKFHIIYSDLFFTRFVQIMLRSVKKGELTFEKISGIIASVELMKVYVKESNFCEYAFRAIIKGKDSQV